MVDSNFGAENLVDVVQSLEDFENSEVDSDEIREGHY